MLWILLSLYIFNSFIAGIDLTSIQCRRQILTSKVIPRIERVKLESASILWHQYITILKIMLWMQKNKIKSKSKSVYPIVFCLVMLLF